MAVPAQTGCPPTVPPVVLLDDEDVVEPPAAPLEEEEEDVVVVPPVDEELDVAGAPLVEEEADVCCCVVVPLPLVSGGSFEFSSSLFVRLVVPLLLVVPVPRLRVGAAFSISDPSTGGGAHAIAIEATVPAMTRPVRKREVTIRIMHSPDQDHGPVRENAYKVAML